MVTDLEEVYRLGTAKADENLDFRRYLSAHHHRDEPFQVLASEVQREIDCTACANCCRHSVVSVDHADLEAIAGHVGCTREQAAHRYTEADAGAPALRTLRNVPDRCVFLENNLCTIYDARPKACRDFPHVTVGTHSLGARPSSLDRWAARCPIVYNALERYKHLTGYHPRHA